jgi:hypothetical protein
MLWWTARSKATTMSFSQMRKMRRRKVTATDTANDDQGNQHEPRIYEIRIQGHLDDRRAVWFEGMTLTREDNGATLLTGPVIDQAALHGLLRKVRDLGLPLIAVARISPGQADA